jgi:hypothetical protein
MKSFKNKRASAVKRDGDDPILELDPHSPDALQAKKPKLLP